MIFQLVQVMAVVAGREEHTVTATGNLRYPVPAPAQTVLRVSLLSKKDDIKKRNREMTVRIISENEIKNEIKMKIKNEIENEY